MKKKINKYYYAINIITIVLIIMMYFAILIVNKYICDGMLKLFAYMTIIGMWMWIYCVIFDFIIYLDKLLGINFFSDFYNIKEDEKRTYSIQENGDK